jgi:hypothetical protein
MRRGRGGDTAIQALGFTRLQGVGLPESPWLTFKFPAPGEPPAPSEPAGEAGLPILVLPLLIEALTGELNRCATARRLPEGD